MDCLGFKLSTLNKILLDQLYEKLKNNLRKLKVISGQTESDHIVTFLEKFISGRIKNGVNTLQIKYIEMIQLRIYFSIQEESLVANFEVETKLRNALNDCFANYDIPRYLPLGKVKFASLSKQLSTPVEQIFNIHAEDLEIIMKDNKKKIMASEFGFISFSDHVQSLDFSIKENQSIPVNQMRALNVTQSPNQVRLSASTQATEELLTEKEQAIELARNSYKKQPPPVPQFFQQPPPPIFCPRFPIPPPPRETLTSGDQSAPYMSREGVRQSTSYSANLTGGHSEIQERDQPSQVLFKDKGTPHRPLASSNKRRTATIDNYGQTHSPDHTYEELTDVSRPSNFYNTSVASRGEKSKEKRKTKKKAIKKMFTSTPALTLSESDSSAHLEPQILYQPPQMQLTAVLGDPDYVAQSLLKGFIDSGIFNNPNLNANEAVDYCARAGLFSNLPSNAPLERREVEVITSSMARQSRTETPSPEKNSEKDQEESEKRITRSKSKENKIESD